MNPLNHIKKNQYVEFYVIIELDFHQTCGAELENFYSILFSFLCFIEQTYIAVILYIFLLQR